MLRVEEIRARRKIEKKTQAEFAEILGISRQQLSDIERERVKPSKRVESRYDAHYPKRLINITWSRGVECLYCHGTSPLVQLNDPEDELDKIYRCGDCEKVFTVGQSWGLHYRA